MVRSMSVQLILNVTLFCACEADVSRITEGDATTQDAGTSKNDGGLPVIVTRTGPGYECKGGEILAGTPLYDGSYPEHPPVDDALAFFSPVEFRSGTVYFKIVDGVDTFETSLDERVSTSTMSVYVRSGANLDVPYCLRVRSSSNWLFTLPLCTGQLQTVWDGTVPGVFSPFINRDCRLVNGSGTIQRFSTVIRSIEDLDIGKRRDVVVLEGLDHGLPEMTGYRFHQDGRGQDGVVIDGEWSEDQTSFRYTEWDPCSGSIQDYQYLCD